MELGHLMIDDWLQYFWQCVQVCPKIGGTGTLFQTIHYLATNNFIIAESADFLAKIPTKWFDVVIS